MRKYYLLASVFLVSSCVKNYPIPLDEPSEGDSILVVSGERQLKPGRPGGAKSALNTPRNLNDLKLNVRVYQDHYLHVHNRLMQENMGADDVGIFGGNRPSKQNPR